MRRILRTATVVSAVLAAGALTAASGDAAPAAHHTLKACIINDGDAETGEKFGSDPPKYEYGNSPYLGVRYNSCSDVIKVYYGGYTDLTHYNVMSNLRRQQELKAGPKMVWTVTPYFATGDHWERFAVQGCIRGNWPNPSKCTRWSPTVWIHIQR
jgi:hypothetical protein